MWTLKTHGNSYYVNHINSNCSWSTKETPDNNHTKGSIKFKNCYLTIQDNEAEILASSGTDNHVVAFTTAIPGSTPGASANLGLQCETGNNASAETDEISGSTPEVTSQLNYSKLYIVTRKDLPSIGYQAVQATHALHEFEQTNKEAYSKWIQSPTLVMLTVNTLEELETLSCSISYKQRDIIPFTSWYEEDLNNQLTSIAFIPNEYAKSKIKHLKLLGK